MRLALLLLLPGLLGAQLITSGPVPKGPNPPVVFLDGYQASCTGSDFASNFFAADKLLQASSIVTLYFDNCSVGGIGPARPTIEAEGIAFGKFLAALKYTDGTPVTQVDVVAHSMGGLIVRSYLAGKQDVTPAAFMPPATPLIRRAIFLGTPHFGTKIAALLGSDVQTAEMSPGSQFLFDLNYWNQGTDDLRGVAALSVAGSGSATGGDSNIPSFDDGVVALTSSSLGYYRSGATRVIPYCHTMNSLLEFLGCPSSVPVLNNINTDPNNLVSQLIVSFLTGTTAWQSVGQAAEANSLLSAKAGAVVELRDQNDAAIPVIGAVAGTAPNTVSLSANLASSIAYNEALSVSKFPLQISPLSGAVQSATLDLTLSATTELPAVFKPGPMISPKGIIPAAGPPPFPYDVAPGAFVSIYGTNLASSNPLTGQTQPYPTQVGDVQVLVNGTAAPIEYAGMGLINIVFPSAAPGLATLTVMNAQGRNTVNVRVAPAVPSIFLLDYAAATAAAVNALTGTVVGSSSPLHASDFVSLYLTGLGATMLQNSLNYAQTQPTITIGGQSVAVLYAGRSPGFAGLDQINAQIPAGVTGAAVPVVVNSGGRLSSTAYIAIR